MKFNIINLIDNFDKSTNYSTIQVPASSQTGNQFDLHSSIDFLKNSQNYLIFENRPQGAIKLLNILLKKGRKGIIITRNHPDKFGQNLISNKIDMYWLSSEDFDYVIRPWEINLLINTVEEFVKQNNRGVILLNGLEYLSTYNNSKVIFNMLLRMNNIVMNTDAMFLITIDPIALGNQFLMNIKSNSEIIKMTPHFIKEVIN